MANPGLTATFANNILAWLCRAVAMPTAPTGLFIQLHTGQPGAAGTSNISVGSSTRVAIAFATESGGANAQTGTAPTWTNGGTSETLTHVSLWSAATSGTFYWSFPLTATQAWAATNTYTLSNYGLGFTPIAA
jgi:hypothetical protein